MATSGQMLVALGVYFFGKKRNVGNSLVFLHIFSILRLLLIPRFCDLKLKHFSTQMAVLQGFRSQKLPQLLDHLLLLLHLNV